VVPLRQYEHEKAAFVKNWLTANIPPDKNGQERSPDEEQVTAVAAVHGHVQVVAVLAAEKRSPWSTARYSS
jgi:DNA helicase IV